MMIRITNIALMVPKIASVLLLFGTGSVAPCDIISMVGMLDAVARVVGPAVGSCVTGKTDRGKRKLLGHCCYKLQ